MDDIDNAEGGTIQTFNICHVFTTNFYHIILLLPLIFDDFDHKLNYCPRKVWKFVHKGGPQAQELRHKTVISTLNGRTSFLLLSALFIYRSL
jgi:hypothetical protein